MLAERIAAMGVRIHPCPLALRTAQDRLLEKQLFRRLGIGTPDFEAVDTFDAMRAAVERIGLPCVVKTRRYGYDGKGQAVVREPGDLIPAWNLLQKGVPGAHVIEPPAVPLIVEGFVPFDRELSVLAARGGRGVGGVGGAMDERVYPLTENRHEGGILRVSRGPAPGLSPALQAEGEAIARRVGEALGYAGLLAVELFQVGERLLANEIAPRVHNSGHWTMDGAVTCQFENHVRAVMGWPLGDASARGCSAMVNLIGSHPPAERLAAIPGVHLHLYGKQPRPGRKLGHLNVVGDSPQEREARLEGVLKAISS
jgi:5-(carboxyamino)imidazole ribonucleotide synthase